MNTPVFTLMFSDTGDFVPHGHRVSQSAVLTLWRQLRAQGDYRKLTFLNSDYVRIAEAS